MFDPMPLALHYMGFARVQTSLRQGARIQVGDRFFTVSLAYLPKLILKSDWIIMKFQGELMSPSVNASNLYIRTNLGRTSLYTHRLYKGRPVMATSWIVKTFDRNCLEYFSVDVGCLVNSS